MSRRVVVTGIGLICGVGNTTPEVWNNLLAGKSGMATITAFDPTDFPVTFAAEVKNFDPLKFIDKKESRKMARFIHFALAATAEAMAESGLKITPENEERVGVHIGSGIGGFDVIEREHSNMLKGGPRKISPFFIPAAIVNLAAGNVSIRYGAKGPNEATATACTTSAHSIGDAYRLIQRGDADAMIAGGAEAAITPMGVGGFAAMRALSTRNDDPEHACRPFDKDRDGFVVGEGAGILILEELEFAQARGAKILAEIIGYGMSADAFHITGMPPEGEGCYRAMRNAVKSAGNRACGYSVRERPRDVDAAWRCSRNRRAAQALRRTRHQPQAAGQLHQIHDRTSAWRRRRPRSRHRDSGTAHPDCATNLKSRRSRPGMRPQLRPQYPSEGGNGDRAIQFLRIRRYQRVVGL